MSISVTNLRQGTVFEHNGSLYSVLKYEHQKLGRGTATIKVKVKNIKTGSTREFGFGSGQEIEEVEVHKKDLEFVYKDQRKNQIILTDPQNKSKRYSLDALMFGEKGTLFLKGGIRLTVLKLEETDEIVDVEIPITVELKVEETGPKEAGDTATAPTKPATLETGAVIQVPIFIKNGDVLKVNTETGEYVERITRD